MQHSFLLYSHLTNSERVPSLEVLPQVFYITLPPPPSFPSCINLGLTVLAFIMCNIYIYIIGVSLGLDCVSLNNWGESGRVLGLCCARVCMFACLLAWTNHLPNEQIQIFQEDPRAQRLTIHGHMPAYKK